ncbi:hypothetical protein BgiMline_031485 [Biomphalaria glabrata]
MTNITRKEQESQNNRRTIAEVSQNNTFVSLAKEMMIEKNEKKDIRSSCGRSMLEAEERFGKELIRTGAVCDCVLNVYVVHDCHNTTNMQTCKLSSFSSIRATSPPVACTRQEIIKDFKFSMIVNVHKDHVVEITEWTKAECNANGKCRQKTCRNHITFVNDVCLFEFSYHICVAHPPLLHLIYKTINKLAKYLLRCTFPRSISILNATIAKIYGHFTPHQGTHLLSSYGDVFKN